MNSQEIEQEKAIDRDVVIYVRFPSDVTDEQVHSMSKTLYEFCDMLGATVADHYWEVADDYRQQHKFKVAMKAMNKTKYRELVTYDLNSLTADVQHAVSISEEIISKGGWVYYVDDESVFMECQMLMNYNREDDVQH